MFSGTKKSRHTRVYPHGLMAYRGCAQAHNCIDGLILIGICSIVCFFKNSCSSHVGDCVLREYESRDMAFLLKPHFWGDRHACETSNGHLATCQTCFAPCVPNSGYLLVVHCHAMPAHFRICLTKQAALCAVPVPPIGLFPYSGIVKTEKNLLLKNCSYFVNN